MKDFFGFVLLLILVLALVFFGAVVGYSTAKNEFAPKGNVTYGTYEIGDEDYGGKIVTIQNAACQGTPEHDNDYRALYIVCTDAEHNIVWQGWDGKLRLVAHE